MANKQILIAQYDFGIVLEIQILDADKNVVPILTDKVVANIIYPDQTKRIITMTDTTDPITITNNSDGIVQFPLKVEDTSQLGNCSVYVELISTGNYQVTTTSAINYFVVERTGGVE